MELAGGSPFAEWLDQNGAYYFALIADDLWDQISEFRSGPTETKRGLRKSVVSHLPGLKAALAGRDESVDLPEEAREFAGLVARSNLPLSAILRSYELGHAAIWKAFTDYLRSCNDLALSQRAASLQTGSVRMFDYITTMTGETINEYTIVKESVLRQADSQKIEIVRSVLAGHGGSEDLSEFLGYHVDGLNIGFVAWTTTASQRGELPELARRTIGLSPQQQIVIPSGSSTIYGWFSLKQPTEYDALSDRSLPAGMGLTIGAPRYGLQGFRQTHYEASLSSALDTGRLSNPILFPDVAVHILMTQNKELARRFVDDEIGPLIHHQDRDRLLPTLRFFLATLGSPSRAARRLGVHPNTTTQRIHRIETILGSPIDPSDFNLRVAVELAHYVAELR